MFQREFRFRDSTMAPLPEPAAESLFHGRPADEELQLWDPQLADECRLLLPTTMAAGVSLKKEDATVAPAVASAASALYYTCYTKIFADQGKDRGTERVTLSWSQLTAAAEEDVGTASLGRDLRPDSVRWVPRLLPRTARMENRWRSM